MANNLFCDATNAALLHVGGILILQKTVQLLPTLPPVHTYIQLKSTQACIYIYFVCLDLNWITRVSFLEYSANRYWKLGFVFLVVCVFKLINHG